MRTRYLVIADVHANYQALSKLTDLDVITDEDLSIIFIGDYLDGLTLTENATIKTLEFIKDLQKNRQNVYVLLGNHDIPIVKIFKNEKLNKYLKDQSEMDLTWTRDEFFSPKLYNINPLPYYKDKTIILGHTPVQTLNFGNTTGEPINLINPNSWVIDGGSNSKKEIDTTHINASLFTQQGQLIENFKLSSKEQN